MTIEDREKGLVSPTLASDNIEYAKTPNMGAALSPDSVVIHYTAQTSTDGAVRSLSDPKRKVSAHFVIGRDGLIIQMVPLNRQAWHAGRSSYHGRVGYNKYSIGIELVNAGPLVCDNDNNYRTWYKSKIPNDQVEFGRGYHWHSYTKEQIDACWDLCDLLLDTYGIKEILGHEEISPGRKTDPGPAFPLDKFRDRLLNSRDQDEGAEIDTEIEDLTGMIQLPFGETLNLREESNTSAPKLGKMNNKVKVKILEEDGNWTRVSVEGWVSGRYVK
jgi:N-acetylmuramoyl-L-alanine amidase